MAHSASFSFVPPLVAIALSALLIALLLRMPWLPLDHSNERSLHVGAVPRIGGIAIVPSIALMLWWIGWEAITLACAVTLAVVSFLDDRSGLPTLARLGAHVLAAAAFLYGSVSQVEPWLWIVLALAIVWMTNLYNFMDGSDGLAGGMAVIGFGVYAVAAWLQNDGTLATACAVIAAAAAGFLVFNFHPAKVFMGDAGSIPLGFLAAAIGTTGWRDGVWPLWFPVIVFSAFTIDATITLLRRLVRGERVWQAHRSHYYQRLVQLGWGHRGTALAEYAVMIASGTLALMAFRGGATIQILAVAAVGLGLLILAVTIDLAWARRAMRAAGD